MEHTKMIRRQPLALALLLALAAACLWLGVQRSSQARASFVMQLPFEGEYSQNGGAWQPLTARSDLNALNGDLTLRGHFAYDIGGEVQLNYFLNHIMASIAINGETVLERTAVELDIPPYSCGKDWDYFVLPAVTTADTVTITLHNPHRFGNSHAYRDFLDTLYPGPEVTLGNCMLRYTAPFVALGWVVLIVAVLLFGAAGICLIQGNALGGRLARYGLLCLFAGLYTVADTINASPLYSNLALATYGRQLCMMLGLLLFGACVADALPAGVRRVACGAVLAGGVLDAVLMGLSVLRLVELYATGGVWFAAQAVVGLLLAGCCVWALRRGRGADRFALLAPLPLCAAFLLDGTGVFSRWYTQGSCTKIVFAAVMVLYLYRVFRSVVRNHRAAGQLKQMADELEDSRIAIMLSQIQPHFLYNALTSIAQLCEKDPKQAKKTTIAFSEYLRHNMRSLGIREPIPFASELEHIKTYLSIEQIRFGARLSVAYEITATDFAVPALSLQPIVENAVKHGIGQKRGGGTVTIRSSENESAYLVTVRDDGAGFDAAAFDAAAGVTDTRRHVGIANVRGRLAAQCHGTLTIESTPGGGTTATITLPKEDTR